MKTIDMKQIFRNLLVMGIALNCSLACETSCEKQEGPDPFGTDKPAPIKEEEKVSAKGGFLFAHMTKDNYGRIFYSISPDGLKWKLLNSGNMILNDYRGHPDITKGPDGKWYMMGLVEVGGSPLLWKSEDLITWKRNEISKSVFDANVLGYLSDAYLGAPKMFYDETTGQWIITYHCGSKDFQIGSSEFWHSMTTMYILTRDFETFTKPKMLFDSNLDGSIDFKGDDANIATIDVIIRKYGDTYYAIFKDERESDVSRTGKAIRISRSKYLTGPYSQPGPALTPSGREAPSIVQLNNGSWRLYTEVYPREYACYESNSIETGNWKENASFVPPVARHDIVVCIDGTTYKNILKAFDK